MRGDINTRQGRMAAARFPATVLASVCCSLQLPHLQLLPADSLNTCRNIIT